MRSIVIDLLKPGKIADLVECDSLVQIFSEQSLGSSGITGRQQVKAEILGANRVGLFLFAILALIVAADCHGKAEPDDDAQQCEGGSLNYAEILAAFLIKPPERFVEIS